MEVLPAYMEKVSQLAQHVGFRESTMLKNYTRILLFSSQDIAVIHDIQSLQTILLPVSITSPEITISFR